MQILNGTTHDDDTQPGELDANNEIQGTENDDAGETQAAPQRASKARKPYARRSRPVDDGGDPEDAIAIAEAALEAAKAKARTELEAIEERRAKLRQRLGLDAAVHREAHTTIASKPVTNAPKRKPRVARAATPSKRDAKNERLDELLVAVKETLADEPNGLRSEQIREKLGVDAKEMPRILKRGIAEGHLTAKGQKRSTTYHLAD